MKQIAPGIYRTADDRFRLIKDVDMDGLGLVQWVLWERDTTGKLHIEKVFPTKRAGMSWVRDLLSAPRVWTGTGTGHGEGDSESQKND